MAKPLVFQFREQLIEVALEKIDRAKLYGYAETEVQDEAGKRCELATLLGDGHSIVGKGGSAIAYLSADGLWRTRSELQPIDVHGKPITPVKSSFDAPIPLADTATIDEFLSHNIHLIYQIVPAAEPTELLAELKRGAIFRFPFSYRGGVEASPAFLLLGSDGTPFLCVGTPTAIEFVGPTATAPVVAEDTADIEEEDALDFSLV
ncbi:MAG: hypothetical protein U0792_16140 [Gemmataceae bacterium]